MEENISHWDIFLQTRRTEKADEENILKKKKNCFPEEKNGKVNGGKYFENENIFLAEEKKNIEGKGGKYSYICIRKQIYLFG